MNLALLDNTKAREQNEFGEYVYVQRTEEEMDSQSELFRMAYGEYRDEE
ncbi:hypothetical protein GCM10020331_044230 [Ectobacillus funiculus]